MKAEYILFHRAYPSTGYLNKIYIEHSIFWELQSNNRYKRICYIKEGHPFTKMCGKGDGIQEPRDLSIAAMNSRLYSVKSYQIEIIEEKEFTKFLTEALINEL